MNGRAERGQADHTPDSAIHRDAAMARARRGEPFDLFIVGGGATGLGIALDAAARGLSVALAEREDFAKGTSSRATKLVHGGVRYLAQGNVSLVREALHERRNMLDNAPHLASPLPFLMPTYGAKGRFWDTPFYGIGLKLYDLLAGRQGLGGTDFLNAREAREVMPGVRDQDLTGAVRYWDGQFDDARFALALARTAASKGACLLNHTPVLGLLHAGDQVRGARLRDQESGAEFEVHARCVVNATGVWVDAVRRMNGAHDGDMVSPSQGIHLVVDRELFPGDHALLVPKTRDGRVLFAVPWLGKVLLGTTDTPRDRLDEEPRPLEEEIEFVLGESALYLARPPRREDVRSVWVGLRPLVKPPSRGNGQTKTISREHTIVVDPSGLVTVTGGKWTTYRAMAEDVMERCMDAGLIPRSHPGITEHLRLAGAPRTSGQPLSAPPGPHLYGSDMDALLALPGAENELHPGLTEAMVRFAVRMEGARTVEDMLARRSRLLFLDARAAMEVAPTVATIMAEELGPGFDAAASTRAFQGLARGYTLSD
ncbi:MAG: FAD-dependent oxidoreductase [Gammaproteobacteria bacterium]